MTAEKHLRLVAEGSWTTAPLTVESWAVGLNLALVFGAVDDVGTFPSNYDPQATVIDRHETHWDITGNWLITHLTGTFNPGDYLNDQAAPAFATWMAAWSGRSSQCRLDRLKLGLVGTDGKEIPPVPYTSGTPCLLEWTSSNPVGINGGDLLPIENALVTSHHTNQRGRKGRGRMYLPGIASGALTHQGEVSSGTTDEVRNAQIALLEGVAFSGTGTDQPHVRPVITGVPYALYATITQVKVGNVVDTQRRRRRSLVETYSAGDVSY